jgi:thioredoxin 2
MDQTRLHVSCPHCQATNRLPAERLGDAPNCGRCGQPLLEGQPVELTDANFDTVALASDLPLLVDFWAPWCGPCRAMSPVVDEIAKEYEGKAKVVKVNVDDNADIPGQFNVMSIPTFIVFKDGSPVAQIVGGRPKGDLTKELDAAIA